ncbi:hypothetical protein SBRCBS47491_002406 [Sporothrix bragantina]|uniref:polynucleotide adenylyltransferase n=1 Tax=Sporothrix bragantina TaxID=671064 RepID=A0ABP0B6R4_9PEZI
MDSRPITAEPKHTPQSSFASISPSSVRASPAVTTPRLPSSIPLPETPVSPAAAAAAFTAAASASTTPSTPRASVITPIPQLPTSVTPTGNPPVASVVPGAPPLDLIPILFPQHPSIYQAQLLNYNRLISPTRGGGVGLQTPPLPPVLSAPFVQASAPRSRSSSKSHHNQHNSHHHGGQQQQQQTSQSPPQAQSTQNCHGNKVNKNADKLDRTVTKMGKETTQKASKQQQQQQQQQAASSSTTTSSQPPNTIPSSSSTPQIQQTGSADLLAAPSSTRPVAVNSSTGSRQQQHRSSKSPRPYPKAPLAQASSVPSTPHQHARNFSFASESREPSPNATQNHSPRSAYSETNSALPSLRPLPPRYNNCIYESNPTRPRRRMNYSLGTDRLETIPLDKVKSKLSADEEKTLTGGMKALYDRLRPSEETEARRKTFVEKLQTIFNEQWPGHDIRVHIFGSSGNRLCSDDSDVDICITTDWKEMENVCMIADLLAKRGMEKVVCVSSAKVPIVRIWDPELKLACDMNVNNTLALENTRMVLTYVNIDERVRPLAMIIKHWTRRRIINDAAYGQTLSSYTWICMVICFLQLRKIPILPSIHQRKGDRLPRTDGKVSDFADDMSKLRGFGEPNKETLGELLFSFFRFYAHEFDYNKHVLSVRLGRLATKTEKKWHTALNNMLCVEEPFNIVRNLGNTADDTSFRGLHMEMRRAFDLISEAKLDECCEEYVFPKEEERIFQKPAQAPRPILMRSSSQQHSNSRGGGGGGRGGSFRGNRQYRSGNNSRRASSSIAYDGTALYGQGSPMMPVLTEMQWWAQHHQVQQQVQQQLQQQATAVAAALAQHNGQQQQQQQQQSQQSQQTSQQGGSQTPQTQQQQAQQPHYVFHPDMLASTLNALQMQQAEQSLLRYQMFTNPQAYVQQHHALAHAQRIQQQQHNTAASSTTDRSRTNSLDNPPMTAPIRPELYMYAIPPVPTPFYVQPGYGTLPSSPSTSTAPSEFRRSLHRAGPTSDATSTGTLRSQSQPASRPSMTGSQSHGSLLSAMQFNGSGQPSGSSYARSAAHSIPIPSFIRDDNADSEAETTPTTATSATASKALSGSQSSEEDGPQYIGYYVNDSASAAGNGGAAQAASSDAATASTIANSRQKSSPSTAVNGIPSFGDLSPSDSLNQRRLSTDQLPHYLIDRRMRRASRSPSPLGGAHNGGHGRAQSVGGSNTAPTASGPFTPVAGNRQTKEASRSPLVVNGSISGKPPASLTLSPNGMTNGLSNGLPNGVPNFHYTTSPGLPNGIHHGSAVTSSSRHPSASESVMSDESTAYGGLGISMGGGAHDAMLPPHVHVVTPPAVEPTQQQQHMLQSPVIANGSAPLSSVSSPNAQSFNQRVAAMAGGFSPLPYAAIAGGHGHGMTNGMTNGMANGMVNGNGMAMPPLTSPRQRNLSRQQQKGIAPLDLAMPEHPLSSSDMQQHLSPVYENRTPSPTNLRKLDSMFAGSTGGSGRTPSSATPNKLSSHADKFSSVAAAAAAATASSPSTSSPIAYNGSHAGGNNGGHSNNNNGGNGGGGKTARKEAAKKAAAVSKPNSTTTPATERVNGKASVNGHVRGAKSESADVALGGIVSSPMVTTGNNNGWQKPKSRKKAADLKAVANGHAQAHGEQLPKNESERKGG